MGRKKGKQAGSFGSKRLRHAAERVRTAESRDDLRRIASSSQCATRRGRATSEAEESSSEGNPEDSVQARHAPHAHAPTETHVAMRRRFDACAAGSLKPRRLASNHTLNVHPSAVAHAKKREATDFVVDTLFSRCCLAVARDLDFYEDADWIFREVLPVQAVELIARCATVTDRTLPLVANHAEVRWLDVSGAISDAAAIEAILPGRNADAAVVDAPENWDDGDRYISGPSGPAPALRSFSGCLHLETLVLDAPLSFAFFERLALMLPTLQRLALGPSVPACEKALRVMLTLPALAVLDLSHYGVDTVCCRGKEQNELHGWRKAAASLARRSRLDAATDAVFTSSGGPTSGTTTTTTGEDDDCCVTTPTSLLEQQRRRRRPGGVSSAVVVLHRWEGVPGVQPWRIAGLATVHLVHVDATAHGLVLPTCGSPPLLQSSTPWLSPSFAPLLRRWDCEEENREARLLPLPV